MIIAYLIVYFQKLDYVVYSCGYYVSMVRYESRGMVHKSFIISCWIQFGHSN